MQRNALQCNGENNTTGCLAPLASMLLLMLPLMLPLLLLLALMMAARQCSAQMCWCYLKFKIKPNLNSLFSAI